MNIQIGLLNEKRNELEKVKQEETNLFNTVSRFKYELKIEQEKLMEMIRKEK